LKPLSIYQSPIYGVFSILVLNLSSSSLANKFYSIALEFGPKKCNHSKNKFKDKIKKNLKVAQSIQNICEKMSNAIFHRKKTHNF